jgi:hypothetical protein
MEGSALVHFSNPLRLNSSCSLTVSLTALGIEDIVSLVLVLEDDAMLSVGPSMTVFEVDACILLEKFGLQFCEVLA